MEEDSKLQIILALIAFFGTVVGAIIGYWGKSRKQIEEDAKREQMQNDNFEKIFEWMRRVDHKLDIHNGYAEKFSSIEKTMAEIKTDINYLKRK